MKTVFDKTFEVILFFLFCSAFVLMAILIVGLLISPFDLNSGDYNKSCKKDGTCNYQLICYKTTCLNPKDVP